jgi:hypothetical protein
MGELLWVAPDGQRYWVRIRPARGGPAAFDQATFTLEDGSWTGYAPVRKGTTLDDLVRLDPAKVWQRATMRS